MLNRFFRPSNVGVRRAMNVGQMQSAQFSSKNEGPQDNSYLFAHDSTPRLIKKFFMYKFMGSNFFINQSLRAVMLSYKILGINLTNWCIHNSVGDILTGGENLGQLKSVVNKLEKRNVGTMAGLVVEGLESPNAKVLDEFTDFSIKTIRELTEGREEAHFAFKFTAYVDTELMRKMNTAHVAFCKDILQVSYDPNDTSVLSEE